MSPNTPAMKVSVENHGTIALVRPLDSTAREWLEEHTLEEAQWFGGALVVEPRYLENLIDGFTADGGEVS